MVLQWSNDFLEKAYLEWCDYDGAKAKRKEGEKVGKVMEQPENGLYEQISWAEFGKSGVVQALGLTDRSAAFVNIYGK